MTVFQYKVESSQVAGVQALQDQLNLAGADRWELIVADDSGILIYKQSAGSPTFTYKVDQPPATITQPANFQSYLDGLGNEGWELIAISVMADRAFFKQQG